MGPETSTRGPQATWGSVKTASRDPGNIFLHPYRCITMVPQGPYHPLCPVPGTSAYVYPTRLQS